MLQTPAGGKCSTKNTDLMCVHTEALTQGHMKTWIK